MGVTHITTHTRDALARATEKLKGKPNFEALVSLFANRTQGQEDAIYSLFSERVLSEAEGVQLDVLGLIVGQERGPSTDAQYRLKIAARVRANRSRGTVDDILCVFTALLGTADDLRLEPQYPAAFALYVGSVVDDEDTLDVLVDFLGDSKAAGVGAHLVTTDVTNEHRLRFAPTTLTTVDLTTPYAGKSLHVVDTSNFLDAGYLWLQPFNDVSVVKIVTYTSKTATSFENLTDLSSAPATVSDGALVMGLTPEYGVLSDIFEGTPFPSSMPVYDTEKLPSAGAVLLGAGFEANQMRVFTYTSKTATSLEGVVATNVGTGENFVADLPILSTQHGCASDDYATTTDNAGCLATADEA